MKLVKRSVNDPSLRGIEDSSANPAGTELSMERPVPHPKKPFKILFDSLFQGKKRRSCSHHSRSFHLNRRRKLESKIYYSTSNRASDNSSEHWRSCTRKAVHTGCHGRRLLRRGWLTVIELVNAKYSMALEYPTAVSVCLTGRRTTMITWKVISQEWRCVMKFSVNHRFSTAAMQLASSAFY